MRILPLVLAALLALPSSARAEEPARDEPPTGIPWLVGGSLVLASGVVNFVGAGLCVATLPSSQKAPCAGTSLAFGGLGVAIGVPLLVVGAGKRGAWQVWFDKVTVRAEKDGAALTFRGAF